MTPFSKTCFFLFVCLFISACGQDGSSNGGKTGGGRGKSDLRGTWEYQGSGFGDFRSATAEFGDDFIQLDAFCASGRGSVFSPIEVKGDHFVVKETHVSSGRCVVAITKGEKGFKFSGDSLIIDGVLGSSRWRRR